MNKARNLSINATFRAAGQRHQPRFRFDGGDFAGWKERALPATLATLGRMPQRVPLNAETIAEWSEDGLIKRKFVIDVEEGLSATGYLFRPANGSGKLPAILACHGHGQFGKDPVMGNRSSAGMEKDIREMNYDYGYQMAKAGFVTIAIDWRGFGDRDDRRKPNWNNIDHNKPAGHGRDLCNLHFLRATMLGQTVLGGDVHDGKAALDFLCQQDFVDANRIGVMGLSFGGAMAAWMALADDRIRAVNIICYSDRFADFGLRDVNLCGSQITPGLFELVDVPDLQGLAAPRPLLVEIGTFDECFKLESAMSCFREVEKIYTAAGQREKLDLDLFEGPHAWGGNKSVGFFKKHLG